MRVIEFSRERALPIEQFDSRAASAVHLGDGAGEAHVYCLHFEAGGGVGEHVAGFDQLFLVVSGEGWAAGADGRRVKLSAGEGAFFERGETHSKGSDAGMVAVMVQASKLETES
jgi:quercetin dioxygenase-like cupin family protein